MRAPPKWLWTGGLIILLAGICAAQDWGGGGRRWRGWRGANNPEAPFVRTEGRDLVNEDTVRTARETASHSTGTPNWTNEAGFGGDVFTFARVIYKFDRASVPSQMAWINDYPDSDLNLSFRLQQLTSIKVDPDARTIKLTDEDLFNYPFIYMVKPGRMELRDEEVPILRKYLNSGGALMADDFWGDDDWANFETQMKRVFPDRQWVELPMNHPIFQAPFPLHLKKDKNSLQVPSIHVWERRGVSHRGGQDTEQMHVRAWLDDKQRVMIIATHNTDNGDGWEREGEDEEYFRQFSETRAYPLGINIIVYLMTH
ncbi:MAG TPA: DUF4159 domain-containing protein [Verrucomicrobiae bacterium]|jgi:hypothetical protein